MQQVVEVNFDSGEAHDKAPKKTIQKKTWNDIDVEEEVAVKSHSVLSKTIQKMKNANGGGGDIS